MNSLAYLKDRYVRGEIELDEFEAKLEDALRHPHYDPVSMILKEVWTSRPGEVYPYDPAQHPSLPS